MTVAIYRALDEAGSALAPETVEGLRVAAKDIERIDQAMKKCEAKCETLEQGRGQLQLSVLRATGELHSTHKHLEALRAWLQVRAILPLGADVYDRGVTRMAIETLNQMDERKL
jgi:hypothetical protein